LSPPSPKSVFQAAISKSTPTTTTQNAGFLALLDTVAGLT
jgi:hypothetical protein